MQLSSKIREQLRTVQETHKKMQAQLTQEEKDLAKGKVSASFSRSHPESLLSTVCLLCLFELKHMYVPRA